jgi:Fe-S-cluster containining protein
MYDFNFTEEFQEKQLYNKFKFKCVKGCDSCCKMNDVALYPFDIMVLCNHLSISTSEFHSHYSYFEFDSTSKILRCYLNTTPRCVFFDTKKACIVYDARPVRCRIFPVARVFNRDGLVLHYLPKRKCPGFFDTGQKFSIEEWISQPSLVEKQELIKHWTNFINELKNSTSLPLTDEFFIMFFKKIFYDFDNNISKAIKTTDVRIDPGDIPSRMQHLYTLAKVYLFNIDKWKKGYQDFVSNLKKPKE